MAECRLKKPRYNGRWSKETLPCGSSLSSIRSSAMPLAPGAFAAIYHSVGTAMLVEAARDRPGRALGTNGVCGNLGLGAGAGGDGGAGEPLRLASRIRDSRTGTIPNCHRQDCRWQDQKAVCVRHGVRTSSGISHGDVRALRPAIVAAELAGGTIRPTGDDRGVFFRDRIGADGRGLGAHAACAGSGAG